MSQSERPSGVRAAIRALIGLMFMIVAAKNFVDSDTIFAILFLLVGLIFLGFSAVSFFKNRNE
ncbi:hypothetical protein ACSL103130_12105 [Actinomyces slackii]|uniref:Uncharacterized protein n=1 Tax=Actinomyces slackii TaxID=52774 RepID=A0A448K9Y5_9ACTO|nr:hypothetical protein [Actinomyces slackii]VEG73738.1 Uncharacterised protein [Actinomyces slackii]